MSSTQMFHSDEFMGLGSALCSLSSGSKKTVQPFQEKKTVFFTERFHFSIYQFPSNFGIPEKLIFIVHKGNHLGKIVKREVQSFKGQLISFGYSVLLRFDALR